MIQLLKEFGVGINLTVKEKENTHIVCKSTLEKGGKTKNNKGGDHNFEV